MNSELDSKASTYSDLYNVEGVANLIGLTPGTVKWYLARGKLPKPDVAVGYVKLWRKATIVEWDRTREKRYDNRKSTNG